MADELDDPPSEEAEEAEADEAHGANEVDEAEEEVSELETRWAAALLMQLVDSGGIEIESEEALLASGILAELADVLRRPDDLADRLLDVLLSSDGVAEVFVSEKPLLVALQESRPQTT